MLATEVRGLTTDKRKEKAARRSSLRSLGFDDDDGFGGEGGVGSGNGNFDGRRVPKLFIATATPLKLREKKAVSSRLSKD